MLLDISKLLTAQMITTAALINIILLSSCCSSVKSLPITSKPIESTAENLAWEAWLMVPVGQQQKSRKVTPKSIFIVPHKNNQTSSCPPGEHWAQNRCIPTVNIDTDKALLNQLSILAPASFNVDYDYDYDEEGDLSPGAEKLEGSADTNPFSNGDAVDEPLKFNIFSDTFPIGSSGSGDSSGSKDSEDENVFFVSERRRRPPTPPEMVLPDLDTDSSNYGSDNHSLDEDSKSTEEDSTLFLSGIDAILVPAVAETEGKDQNMNFSIYQQTQNSTLSKNNQTPGGINQELDDILKNESLFVDKNHGAREKATTTTTTERTESKTTNLLDWETTTMKLEEDEDIGSKTEFTRSVTDLPLIEEETSQPIDFERVGPADATSTMIPIENTTIITEPNEDITTMTSPSKEKLVSSISSTLEVTSPKEQSSTMSSRKGELTTIASTEEEIPTLEADLETTVLPTEDITIPNDETTTFASKQEDLPSISRKPDSLRKETSDSNDRFVYHQLTEENALPPVINIEEELRKINDLVAKNSQLTTTTQKPSVEAISNPTDLLSKIINSPNTIRTSSEDPVPLSSTSTVWTSNSTSRNILSKSISSTDFSTEESQEFTSDPSSSTSPAPEINEPDPYWWLPRGWGTVRTEADRPLLLRFWSAISGISGSQTKV